MKKSNSLFMILMAVALVLMLADLAAQRSQSAEVLLGAALHQEEVEGDYEAAIATYKKLLAEYPDNRPLAARAQFRIGMCYEKLGRKEALKAYEEVLNKYTDQPKFAAMARERLAALKAEVSALTKTVPHKPKFRKIRTPFSIPQWSGSRLSPNGKTLTFGSQNSIWIVPIPGRADPDLAGEPKELRGTADVLGDGLSWSGDGKWIAFSRAYTHAGGGRIRFRPEGAYIDVIPSSGGKPKRIPVPQWVESGGQTFRRLSLSPDGKSVAFDSGGQIYVASVKSGEIKQVTQDGGISPCYSPDGARIAYLTPPIWQKNPNRRQHEVWVISSDGDDPVKVSGDLRDNLSMRGPIWSPDGTMIAFGRVVTKPKLGAEVCIVPLSEKGKPVDSPVQIKLPLFTHDFVVGWTPDNKIGLLLETPYHEYVYTVPVSGGKASQASPLDALASHPRWTPDGERIYFRWERGELGSVPSDGGDLSIHPALKDGITSDFFLPYPGCGNSVSPDGKLVVFSTPTGIYTVPIERGEPRQIMSREKRPRYPCWSPDGRWIAYLDREIIGDEKRIVTIFKIPVEGGEPQKISTESDNVTWACLDWSPDGKSIAYFSKKPDASSGTLNLLQLKGGESRVICQVQDASAQSDASWAPGGEKIAFVSRGKIWVVPSDGGEPVEVKTDVDAWASKLDWSPDGEKIAFSGESGMDIEFWFMEDFLPLVKGRK